jgi:hypothetical protein
VLEHHGRVDLSEQIFLIPGSAAFHGGVHCVLQTGIYVKTAIAGIPSLPEPPWKAALPF